MNGEKKFWSGKHVLVTGADGFVGGNLIQKLLYEGAHVFAFLYNKNRIHNPMFATLGSKCQEIIEGDVRNYDSLNKVFTEKKIEICFHLAAQAIVAQAFENPLPTFQINIQGTIHILEAARRTEDIKGVILASTSHVYGSNKNLPYLESFFPEPTRPYETSKACADILAQTYHYTYGLPVAIARCTNTYGPGDMNFSRIVPKTMMALLEKKNPEIVGGISKRDYLYVTDAVSGYLTIAENLDRREIKGEPFNFGSGNVVSGIELAKMILRVAPQERLELQILAGENHRDLTREIDEQYVSTDKAKSLLGWTPQFSLEEGLKKTFAWYQEYFEKRI